MAMIKYEIFSETLIVNYPSVLKLREFDENKAGCLTMIIVALKKLFNK